MNLTAVRLEFLLKCYYLTDSDTISVQPVIEPFKKWLLSLKLAETNGHIFRLTIHGQAWVEAILATPVPEKSKDYFCQQCLRELTNTKILCDTCNSL